MKKILTVSLTIALLLVFANGFSQTGNSQDTMRKYYSRLANSKDDADKALLETKLYTLLKSPKEEDWNTASNFFYQLKKANTVDSIHTAIKIKFPMGMAIRDAAADTIYKQQDPVEKEMLYKTWVKKFPPEKFGTERITYDYARAAVARAYAEADNVKKALEYSNMVETPIWKGEGWAGTAGVLAKNNHLDEAADLFKKARDNSYKYMQVKVKDNGAMFAATGYVSYNSSLADILLKQKKYDQALTYVREAHDSSKNVRGNVNATYAQILMAKGKDAEAFEKINEAVKEGQATPEMKEMLKSLYVKVKGSNAGYDEFVALLNKILAEKTRKELARQIIKTPAPAFTLKDVDGNTVSLADYKGKTVVLDFWATWCGPCKKSFPAMKLAVNRFKNDPNVKFLFIHTWEHDATGVAIDNAKKYISDNNYPFQVLMDLKDSATGLNKTVESFKIEAIPTKFVVDKNGNIRFKFTGFSGGNDAAAEEVAAMIELANKN